MKASTASLKLIWLVALITSLPQDLLAQGTASPLPTPAEAVQPTAAPSSFVRAQPPAATSSGPQAPEAKGPFTGYSGGDLIISRGQVDVPEFHRVKAGDTLWEICGYYFRNPWAWPRIWSYNKAITNPHWIYPGDRVRLRSSGPVATGSAARDLLVVDGERQYGQGSIQLRQDAFADPVELEHSGQIVGSREERRMLASFDQVYLKGAGRFRPQVGHVYTIYKVRQKLRSDDHVIGHLVDVLGTLRVRSINEHQVATAEIIDSYYPIVRGARVGPLRRQYKQVGVRPAERDLRAKVVATLRLGQYNGGGDVVFIDRGSKAGVRNGNRFLVVRRGDGYRTMVHDNHKDDSTFPEETIAEISVLDARDNASVGVITRAKKEVRLGDNLRLRRGY
jgi:hypothetical protein